MSPDEARPEPVPFLVPAFPDVEVVAGDYAEIVASGVFSNLGPRERKFADALADWIGQGVRVSLTANATLATQLACAALFRDAPHALVPSFTAPAGPLAVVWSGYEPLFVDVEPSGWHPDPAAAEAALDQCGERIGGILLTNTFGTGNPDVGVWEALARRHDLPLVVDSAAGFGSTYPSGEPLGARGTCEILSFHATTRCRDGAHDAAGRERRSVP